MTSYFNNYVQSRPTIPLKKKKVNVLKKINSKTKTTFLTFLDIMYHYLYVYIYFFFAHIILSFDHFLNFKTY